MWSKILVGLSIAGGLCGFAALLSLFYLIPIEAMVSANKIEYIYDRLSLHMWFLEMILLISGLTAAVLGFVGYQSVKEEAVKQAIVKTEQEVRAYLKTVKTVKVVVETVDESDKELGSVDYQIQPNSAKEEMQ